MGWDKSLGLTGAQSGHKRELQDAGAASFPEGAGLGLPSRCASVEPQVHGVGKAGRFAPGETGVTLLAVIIPQEAGERPGAAGNTPPHWPRYGRGGRRELSPSLISIVLQGTSGTILPDLMSFAGLFFSLLIESCKMNMVRLVPSVWGQQRGDSCPSLRMLLLCPAGFVVDL